MGSFKGKASGQQPGARMGSLTSYCLPLQRKVLHSNPGTAEEYHKYTGINRQNKNNPLFLHRNKPIYSESEIA